MWDWAGADLLSKVTLDTAAISGVAFHPFDNNLVITHGRGHLAFWNRWMSGYLNTYSISTQYLLNIYSIFKQYLRITGRRTGSSPGLTWPRPGPGSR